MSANEDVQCECGEWGGEACQWTGPVSETVRVEWMPEYLRSSHEAARNAGTWPHNGSVRSRVHHECAEMMRECDPEWVEEV